MSPYNPRISHGPALRLFERIAAMPALPCRSPSVSGCL